MSNLQIPSIYDDDDIVYHYTNSSIAILEILTKKRLKFSLRSASNDPIENPAGWTISIISSDTPSSKNGSLQLAEDVAQTLKNSKQICFCMNDFDNKVGVNSNKRIENYGFAKPRMWDQYGDKYKGVCLAFSLSALKKEVEGKEIFGDMVKYISYNSFVENHEAINPKKIAEMGFEHYKLKFMESHKNRLFNKHLDYINENEYRFCTFNENSDIYIDITNCLRGVIISNQSINTYLLDAFHDLVSPNIDVKFISFRNSKIDIYDLKKIITDTKKMIEKVKWYKG